MLRRACPQGTHCGRVRAAAEYVAGRRLETSQATRKRGLSSSNGGSTAERPERADLGHAHNREEAPGGALVDDFRTLPLGQIVAGIPHIGELSLL